MPRTTWPINEQGGPMFTAAVFTTTKTCKQPKWLSTDEWIKKMWYIYTMEYLSCFFQLLSCVWLFATPWPAAHQASLSFTISQSLLKFMSIESVRPSNHLILCHPFSFWPQSFPASGSFQMSQLFASGGQSIGVSASSAVLPMNIQD